MPFIDAMFEVHDGVAVFTMNNPAERNAMTTAMMQNDLPELVRTVRSNADIRALVITGAGGMFSAGGNIKFMKERRNLTVPERNKTLYDIYDWLPELVDLPVPVVAAVEGFAYGAGLSLALTADIILASDRARFCCVFGRVGLAPDMGIMHTLPRWVGLQTAKELIFTARSFGAEEAKSMGLVYRILPAGTVAEAATALAGRFKHASRLAIRNAKTVLNQSYNQDFRTLGIMEMGAQSEARESAYHQEAVDRFLAKQPALFDWDAMDKEAAKGR